MRLPHMLTMRPAQDGGYIVEGPPGPQAPYRDPATFAVLFAGSLDECLSYVAQQFDPSRRV